jgi:hypothetical protein
MSEFVKSYDVLWQDSYTYEGKEHHTWLEEPRPTFNTREEALTYIETHQHHFKRGCNIEVWVSERYSRIEKAIPYTGGEEE